MPAARYGLADGMAGEKTVQRSVVLPAGDQPYPPWMRPGDAAAERDRERRFRIGHAGDRCGVQSSEEHLLGFQQADVGEVNGNDHAGLR
jgi:hypothetical protein